MDWLTSTFAPQPSVATRIGDNNSDDEDYTQVAAMPSVAPILTLPTMSQLNDIMNKYNSNFELKSVRPNDLDTEHPDSIPVDPRPDRLIPIPSTDPNAELQTVVVEKERDRALESLIQTLFGQLNTQAVDFTLRTIVQQAGEKQLQKGNPPHPQVNMQPLKKPLGCERIIERLLTGCGGCKSLLSVSC